jgi:2-aminoadipate transaminase
MEDHHPEPVTHPGGSRAATTAPGPGVLQAAASGSRLDSYVDRYAARTRGMPASEIRALFAVASRPEVVSLAGGMPNITGLSLDVVGSLMSTLIEKSGTVALQYGSGQGDPALREQITEIVKLTGISAHPDDVVVTVGSQHALDLVSRIFLDPGDVIIAEAPSYVGALGTFRAYQGQVVHVEMDDDGIIPDRLREALATLASQGRRAKFLYTIPNFHNPAGVSLSAPRRQEVLEIAQGAGLLVLEDDPYGLLGFDGVIPRALRADENERVIYLGSFSKTFAPGLRVGWAIAPHAVREKLVLAAEASVLCPPAFNQMAISTYLTNYPWFDQVKAFREAYRERRDAMLAALDDMFPPGARWTRPHGGFYVWLTLPGGLDAKAMLPLAVTNRVAYVPGTAFYADGFGSQSLRLSYCYPPPERIREGVRRLAAVVEEELELRAMFGAGRSVVRGGVQNPAPNLS